MSLKSNASRVVLGFLLLLSMSVFAFADTIRLKDGSIIKGKIINFGEGKFVVLIGEGSRQRQMSFFADEVESIEFDGTSIPATNIKTSLPSNTSTARNNPPVNNSSTDDKPTPSKTVIVTDPIKPNTTANNTSTPPKTNPSTTTSQPQIVTNQPTNTPTTSSPVNTPTNSSTAKAITLNVKVLADNTSNGWTNSGWVVRKGQRIRITGAGRISLGNGRFAAPSGVTSLPDKDKLVQAEATGGLIAVIGDDNNDFIFIGAQREFTAARDGALFLGINEGNLDDNSGSFEVTVEILP